MLSKKVCKACINSRSLGEKANWDCDKSHFATAVKISDSVLWRRGFVHCPNRDHPIRNHEIPETCLFKCEQVVSQDK